MPERVSLIDRVAALVLPPSSVARHRRASGAREIWFLQIRKTLRDSTPNDSQYPRLYPIDTRLHPPSSTVREVGRAAMEDSRRRRAPPMPDHVGSSIGSRTSRCGASSRNRAPVALVAWRNPRNGTTILHHAIRHLRIQPKNQSPTPYTLSPLTLFTSQCLPSPRSSPSPLLPSGAFVSAAPVAPASIPEAHAVNVPTVPAIQTRADGVPVASVLTDLTSKLEPVVAELNFIVAGNATEQALGPIVNDVKSVVQDAVNALNILVGQPVDALLKTVDGTAQIAVGDLAKLVAGILTLVFTALGRILGLVGVDVALVIKIVSPLVEVIGALLSIVLKLVGGVLGDLVGTVVGLIGTVVPVILQINVAAVISFLGL
ncbi:hypothetical protein EVG20_g3694 [Dentipellis fragilis]|uniref:Uncharacterized protein n=1 Tax=Dentipellis fragilis TaxID=205917 RepID=A0A4Y9Z0C8_9AGAM|nr:hypothetical protein EVG20_g3694 [Dentipellis fragilis]